MVRRYSKMRPLDERPHAPSPVAAARRAKTTGMRSLGQISGLAGCRAGHVNSDSLVARMGVKHAEVVTARLVQDERGWLRLAS